MHAILALKQPNSKPSQTKPGRKRKNRPQLQAATKRNRAMIPLLETTAAVATPACRAATANRKQNHSSSAAEILLPKLATNSKSKGKESQGKERKDEEEEEEEKTLGVDTGTCDIKRKRRRSTTRIGKFSDTVRAKNAYKRQRCGNPGRERESFSLFSRRRQQRNTAKRGRRRNTQERV